MSQFKVIFLSLILLGFSFVFVVNFGASAEPIPVSANATTNQFLPENFWAVQLGMNLATLAEKRDIKPLMAFDGQATKIWIEEYDKSPYFDKIIYGFDEKEDKLISVALSREATLDTLKEYFLPLLRRSINKWGTPNKLGVDSVRFSKQDISAVTMYWNQKDIVVAVTFTDNLIEKSDFDNNKSAFVIRIFVQNSEIDKKFSIKESRNSNALKKTRKIIADLKRTGSQRDSKSN